MAGVRVKQAAIRAVRRLGYDVTPTIPASIGGRPLVHFLHIGKNAGTQVGVIVERVNAAVAPVSMIKHPHEVRLPDLPSRAPYFFSVRDPASRFVSGFYSRLRKGQPRLYAEWTQHEERAFARFPHANDLAESLFAGGEDGREAARSIRSITHTARSQVDWFPMAGNLLEVRPPVWIIRQASFEADMQRTLERLGVELTVETTDDAVRAHRNDYDGVPALSPVARDNLAAWYAQDVAFVADCEAWLASQSSD